jgi:hypothetical protein
MTSAERLEMNQLVLLIQEEKDRQKFMVLVQRLLDLIARKRKRLNSS